jgi:amidophosphoribosyltransferase
MCGISGLICQEITNGLNIFKSLLALQHRGQDGAGIFWSHNSTHKMIKGPGLVNQVFDIDKLKQMKGSLFVAHNRYKTNNIPNSYQPYFYACSYLSVCVSHNGNITNCHSIKKILNDKYSIPNMDEERSDSEILGQYIFEFLKSKSKNKKIVFQDIIHLSNELQNNLEGSFSLIVGVPFVGLIAIRDKHGIRPLSYGSNEKNDYLISSETSSFNHTDFNYVNDIEPGETILFDKLEKKHYQFSNSEVDKIKLFKPCLFEYLYFSRVDSSFNNISIYNFRKLMGELLGKKLKSKKFDIIVPVPETSRTYAHSLSNFLNIPFQEAIILNRYVNRTFIIEHKNDICEKIKQKFSVIGEIIKDKDILILDDSIVRGNTSKGIISFIKKYNPKSVCFASAAPKVFNPNHFGIHIEKKEELLTSIADSHKDCDLAKYIGADEIFFTEIEDVIELVNNLNPSIQQLEISMFKN